MDGECRRRTWGGWAVVGDDLGKRSVSRGVGIGIGGQGV